MRMDNSTGGAAYESFFSDKNSLFPVRDYFKKFIEIGPGLCYNIGVSLCSRAGVKNPRWQADT